MMTNTNRNNLGVIIIALSSTAMSYTIDVNESNFEIAHNYEFEKKYYLSPKSAEINFDVANTTEVSRQHDNYTGNNEAVLLQFANLLINKNKNIESEFAEIVEKRFWDMI